VSANYHRGPWADSGDAAIDAALNEVRVTRGEYVECQFSEGLRLEPVGADRPAIDVDVIFSEARDQYRADLRRRTCQPDPALDTLQDPARKDTA
jgi:hypothetical protein